jgi:hypothetical protein
MVQNGFNVNLFRKNDVQYLRTLFKYSVDVFCFLAELSFFLILECCCHRMMSNQVSFASVGAVSLPDILVSDGGEGESAMVNQ